MTDLNTAEHVQALGQQAKKASALMAKASAAVKNKALRHLAALLRENTEALQADNAKDLARARAAAGVVADSVPELEWKETEAKARAELLLRTHTFRGYAVSRYRLLMQQTDSFRDFTELLLGNALTVTDADLVDGVVKLAAGKKKIVLVKPI